MSDLPEREPIKTEQARGLVHQVGVRRFDAPVVIDREKCIKGCKICIDSCPVDCLAVDPQTGRAHMQWDECWYCLACEIDCPKDAITVKIPFLIR